MKKSIATLLLVCIIAALFTGCGAPVATYKGAGAKETTAKVRIVTMEGEKFFDDKVKVVDDKPTVYMALKAAADSKKLTLDIMDENDPSKMFLNGISDLKGQDPKYWMYYINKNIAQLGIGSQELKADDVVEFIYGDYNKGYVEVK